MQFRNKVLQIVECNHCTCITLVLMRLEFVVKNNGNHGKKYGFKQWFVNDSTGLQSFKEITESKYAGKNRVE